MGVGGWLLCIVAWQMMCLRVKKTTGLLLANSRNLSLRQPSNSPHTTLLLAFKDLLLPPIDSSTLRHLIKDEKAKVVEMPNPASSGRALKRLETHCCDFRKIPSVSQFLRSGQKFRCTLNTYHPVVNFSRFNNTNLLLR